MISPQPPIPAARPRPSGRLDRRHVFYAPSVAEVTVYHLEPSAANGVPRFHGRRSSRGVSHPLVTVLLPVHPFSVTEHGYAWREVLNQSASRSGRMGRNNNNRAVLSIPQRLTGERARQAAGDRQERPADRAETKRASSGTTTPEKKMKRFSPSLSAREVGNDQSFCRENGPGRLRQVP